MYKKIIIIITLLFLSITYIIISYNGTNNKLSNLGYNSNEIKFIKDNFNKEEINKYLLTKKYNNIQNFKKINIFNIKNISKYEKYKKENTSLSYENIITYVEIWLDQEFYTNIKEIHCLDKLCLVNKYNKLPENYNLNNLIKLSKEYSSTSQLLNNETALAIISMIDDAKKSGYNLNVISGYRTEQYQNTLFNNSVKRNGLEHALKYSAKPGHSEHQTGYAVDLNFAEESFENTKEYAWLKENSYKYGFIERYPKEKEFITGYSYEPWHYRYVGIEASTIIYKQNITFEEYHAKYIN